MIPFLSNAAWSQNLLLCCTIVHNIPILVKTGLIDDRDDGDGFDVGFHRLASLQGQLRLSGLQNEINM